MQPSDVTVTSVTSTGFTFTTGTIHTSGPGATITFNAFDLDGSNTYGDCKRAERGHEIQSD
jgi:hypothetical protein